MKIEQILTGTLESDIRAAIEELTPLAPQGMHALVVIHAASNDEGFIGVKFEGEGGMGMPDIAAYGGLMQTPHIPSLVQELKHKLLESAQTRRQHLLQQQKIINQQLIELNP
jgi:hypothetical protein